MAISPNANALVTATEAAAYLGLGTLTGDDADNLQRQINSASDWIEGWLQVPTIMRSVVEQQYGGGKRIYLRGYPIQSVVSMTDPAGNTIPLADFVVEKDLGRIVHFGRFWVAQTTQGQPTRWDINYIAGWWAGNRQFTGTAGAGTFNAGNYIYVGASWATATKRAAITRVAGSQASPVITYCLIDATDFAASDAVKEYTGSADGDATCTAATPTDQSYADEAAKLACYKLVQLARDAGGASGVKSVSVGSLSVSYGGAAAGFSDSPDAERGYMPNDVVALLAKYKGGTIAA